MTFHLLTIFPEFFRGPFEHGVVSKAREAGALDIRIHNLRDWTHDRHKTVDDRPFGGGEGMLLKPEPLFDAVESIWPVTLTLSLSMAAPSSGASIERSRLARCCASPMPYADRSPDSGCTSTVSIPSVSAIRQACCPPAEPKQLSAYSVTS